MKYWKIIKNTSFVRCTYGSSSIVKQNKNPMQTAKRPGRFFSCSSMRSGKLSSPSVPFALR